MTIATDPLTDKGEKILSAMKDQYGAEKGEQVFYASKNAGTIGGVDQTGLDFLGTVRGFLRGLLAWAKEEEGEAEHVESAAEGANDQDALPPEKPALTGELRRANDEALALDQGSVRSKDVDGRLHVGPSNISKAAVNPYKGGEIPDWEKLGLDPEKTYQLLRHPDELAKAAPSFNNLPILSEHVPISATQHPNHLVIGSTGTDAAFEPPYLKNSLVFWPQAAIDDIENGQKRELSCAYRYRAEMTPGTYEGKPFDGVMRDIVGNHVAAVPEGRAGHDVVVGDAKPAAINLEDPTMTLRERIKGVLKGKLAQDANIEEREQIRGLLKGKIAQDANIEEIMPLIDAVLGNSNGAGVDQQDPMATMLNSAVPMGSQDEEETDEEKEARIRRDCRAADARRRLGRDETDEEKTKREEEDTAADAKAAADRANAIIPSAKDDAPVRQPDLVTKGAMDAAVQAAVTTAVAAAVKRAQEIASETRAAERAVRPYVGELQMSFDSAAQVYRQTLTMLGVDVKGVHDSALPVILSMQPKPGALQRETGIALDSATLADFASRFPDAAKIRVIG